MNLKLVSDKGNRADELLNNEVFKDALANLRNAIVAKWQECPVRDVEAQHELKLMTKLLTDLEANIRVFIQDGQMAVFEINEQRKRDEQRRKVQRFL